MNNKVSYFLKTAVALIILIYFMFAEILYTNEIKTAVTGSINTCLSIIIPSMYGFMITACFILKSGLYKIIGKPLNGIANKLFGISGNEFSIFLLSIFSGYPVGIKLIFEMLDDNLISKEHAENLSCYCYASGPAFIVGTAAITLYGSIKTGLVIFISITIANIIIGLFLSKFNKKVNTINNKEHTELKINSSVLIQSVYSSAVSIFQICIMIIMFSILFTIINKTGAVPLISDILRKSFNLSENTSETIFSSFLEISNISKFEINNYYNLPIITGLLSFGGICVIMQVIAISRSRLNIKKFFTARIFSSIVSGVICKIISSAILSNATVAAYFQPQVRHTEFSIIPSFVLLLMTFILLSNENHTHK